jgi:hypothetical protein
VPGMKGRFRDIVRQFKEKQASQKEAAPEATPAKGEPPRPKFGLRFPSFGNRRKAETKAPEESEKRAPRSTPLLLLGLLGIAVVLGALFLAPRMMGREEPAPFAPPPPPQPLSSPPPPTVPALPTTPTGSELKPTPPGASNDPSQERETPVPVPAPKKVRNPFGDPENRSSGSSAPGSPPAPSAPPASLPPPPTAPKELPPLPPPPAGIPRERASAQPPTPPDVACLAVFFGKEASAVVRAKGFEGVVSVGEAVPGVGKLIEVRPDGCLISIGERKLAVSLEGEKRWK